MPYVEKWHTMSAKQLSKSFGFLRLREIDLLSYLTETLPKDPLIINIGAGVGTSAMAVLQARDDAFVVTVDQRCKEHPLGGLTNEENIIRGAKWLHRRSSICSESSAAGKNWWRFKEESWWRRKVDMVIHDAAHNRDPLTAEIEAWLPRLRAKGVWAIHDYNSKNWGDVVLVVDDILRSQFKYIDLVDTMIAFRKEKV